MFWKRGEAARLGVAAVCTVRGGAAVAEVVGEAVDGGWAGGRELLAEDELAALLLLLWWPFISTAAVDGLVMTTLPAHTLQRNAVTAAGGAQGFHVCYECHRRRLLASTRLRRRRVKVDAG